MIGHKDDSCKEAQKAITQSPRTQPLSTSSLSPYPVTFPIPSPRENKLISYHSLGSPLWRVIEE